MIPSIDTYLKRELEANTQAILSEEWIVEEILADFDEETKYNFIKTYVTGQRPIPFQFMLSGLKAEDYRGMVFIGLREGQESQSHIGNIANIYEEKEGEYTTEQVEIQYLSPEESLDGEAKCYIETTKPMAYFPTSPDITFSPTDNRVINENRMTFRLNEQAIGVTITVMYTEKTGNEEGMIVGFEAEEGYSVMPVSNNMDTMRCIDAIIKASLIIMRSTQQEILTNRMQKLQFAQVTQERPTEDNNVEILYCRENIVFYNADYSLDSPVMRRLKHIRISGGRGGQSGVTFPQE